MRFLSKQFSFFNYLLTTIKNVLNHNSANSIQRVNHFFIKFSIIQHNEVYKYLLLKNEKVPKKIYKKIFLISTTKQTPERI